MQNNLIKVFFRGRKGCQFWRASEKDADRLRDILLNPRMPAGQLGFFSFASLDGKFIAFRMANAQAFHFLWEAETRKMEDYEDDIEIWLSGSEEPIKAYTNTPDQFFDFVTNLGHGADIVAFPGFDDEDGEHLCVNAEEVDFVIAPKELVTTGEETVIQEDGLYEPPPK